MAIPSALITRTVVWVLSTEAFGPRSWSKKTSLTLHETPSSVSSCLILRFAAARSRASSVLRPATSLRSIFSC